MFYGLDQTQWSWNTQPFPTISLGLSGIIYLIPSSSLAIRTALQGTACWLDVFAVCPSIHRQQSVTDLSNGEYPACAAMTTGYVFRVENQATVAYLQRVGRTGCLTTIEVSESQGNAAESGWISACISLLMGSLLVSTAALLTVSRDTWGLTVLIILLSSRLLNIIIIRRRNDVDWAGQREPGEKGDLLVLLSRDRWVRIQGLVDELKAVTSGEWLRDMTSFEDFLSGLATFLVYGAVVMTANAFQSSQILIVSLMMASSGLLAISNAATETLHMRGKLLQPIGPPRQYARRLVLAKELVEEMGRDDWALKMGMINESILEKDKKAASGGVTKDVIM